MNLRISKEQVCQMVLVASCGALVGAWVAEYVFGFQACSLCLYQRYLYMAAIVVLAVNLFILSGRGQSSFLLATSIILLLCSVTAAYQVAIENKWVELPKVCQAPEAGDSFEDFKELITSKPHVSCDQVELSVFGISMAGYNSLLALLLSLFSLMGVFVNDKKKKKFTRR
jgi:disulfide bond formation protein DsbB